MLTRARQVDISAADGRLTLTSGTPVTTADVLAAETIYYCPHKGNRLALYVAGAWQQFAFTELSIDVPDVTNMHDVFAYSNAGAAALEVLAWTDATNRATALARQNGVLVKDGDPTRRYLGSFYSTTAGNGQVEDSFANRNLYNYHHRVERGCRNALETANTWTYSTAAYRQANANTANGFSVVLGVAEDVVEARAVSMCSDSAGGTSPYCVPGIGIDSTTVSSANVKAITVASVINALVNSVADYRGSPGAGRRVFNWLECATTAGVMTFFGDGAVPTLIQAGIEGKISG